MSEQDALNTLIKKRGSLKARLTIFEKYITTIESLNEGAFNREKAIELESRISAIETVLSCFDDIQIEIECQCDEENQMAQILEREQFENKFYSLLSKAKSILEKFELTQDSKSIIHSSSSVSHDSPIQNVKLPEIELPKFNGTYEAWIEFHDMFDSLINKNTQITEIQKFHYLRSSLTENAPHVIQFLEFTSENYSIAWKTLCDRFHNKQLLIQNHLRAIFNAESITTPSSNKIRLLYENLAKHLSSLSQLGEPTDAWDTLLIYITSSKLDKFTAQEWEKQRFNNASITLVDFNEFLKKRANLLETMELNSEYFNKTDTRKSYENDAKKRNQYDVRKQNEHNKPTNRFTQSRGLLNVNENSDNNDTTNAQYFCVNCNKTDHRLFYCSEFLKLSIKDRISRVKYLHLCTNCLKKGHLAPDCKWSGCRICGTKHNTILHQPRDATNSNVSIVQENKSEIETSNAVGPSAEEPSAHVTQCALATATNAILSTAVVLASPSRAKDNPDSNNTNDERRVSARVLLDCGSQSSFITRELCEKLNLKKIPHTLAVSGISDKLSYANYKCDLNIHSLNTSYSFKISCFVLDKITADIPDAKLDVAEFNIPIDIRLADPDFFIPNSIDILIGADAFWQLLSIGRINLGASLPILQNTRLGWIIAGPISMPQQNHNIQSKSHCHFSTNISVQDQLVKFWEVEEVSAKKPWSIEEQECEDHFVKNVYTNSDGRFVVSIPFKESPESLGESHFTAVKRFLALERRLLVNDKLRKLYTDFMSEYESLGHMTEVDDTSTHDLNEPEYFMPHHRVEKKLSSTTSKLRVVFNASSPTSTGLSLNDLQMTGPIIQQELISIILRFRMRPIVLSSDIRMMYRQVLVNPEQRRLQKIVWRDSPDKPIKTYELNTVTYGTTAASFLAIRCLHQIAFECEKEFPEIANIIRNDMYVDDLLTSVDTVEEAKYVYDNISNIFLKYGFELRKWKSNQKNIIPDLNQTDYGNVDFVIDKQTEPKTLGLSWECENDALTYKIQRIDNETNITKRVILSKIASIFDPLGLLSPCIILAKVLLQKLWSENLEWDELVPKHVLDAWLNFSKDLNALNTLKISRMVTCKNPIYIALHAFADASEASYGACIYIVAYDSQNNRVSNLLCAKSKVAPVKTLTIPRLELCAALVLAKLISKCLEALNITFDETYCWTDSTIVLGWLKTTPNLLKPFVSNRVATIQNLTNRFHWRHVPTADNPADIISRGLLPSQLINSKMWFHGPPWLCDPSAWPKTEVTLPELPEKRKICLSIIPIIADFDFDRYSSLNKLKRSFAYVLRFIRNCRVKPEQRNFNFLSIEELDDSFNTLIKIAQLQSFSDDYIVLKKGHTLPNNSKILNLHPFIDTNNILRVGGRLTNSDLPYSKKHPILLSSTHKLTRLIFEYDHVKLLHAGPQLLLSTIRDFFWPISGRNLARKTVKNCVKCARYNPQSVQPIMGNLPNARIKQSPPFSVVGVDYAGPFVMKDRRGRGFKPIKCWVALFVCFSTRALHLEIVLSLSCDDFLQAFNRFVSRRGKPTEVFSDNGTNFVKANKELKEMGEFLASNYSNICDSAANMGIRWHFIPTNSPHFGGIWEAGVKSVKYHLRRVLGSSMIFFYDFQTLLTRIEAILNSRPLSPLSSNPDDLTPLTPAHFLIGRSTMHIQEVPLREIPENRLSQFQVLQKLYEHFWQRWSREYLSELQPRRRWKKNQGAIDVGQLVLVKDDNLPPAMWRLGRIMELVRGKDGVSRVASLKTANGMVSRAVTRLVPLPV